MKWLPLLLLSVMGCQSLLPPHKMRVTIFEKIEDIEQPEVSNTEVISTHDVEITDRQYHQIFGYR